MVVNCLILTFIGFSKNGNSDNNLALVNSLILGFIFFFRKMDVASISLYYCLASSLLYHWQTKIFKKLNGEIIYLDGYSYVLIDDYLFVWMIICYYWCIWWKEVGFFCNDLKLFVIICDYLSLLVIIDDYLWLFMIIYWCKEVFFC